MTRRKPATPEVIAKGGEMLDDGASQLEVVRTLGMSRETLVKHFPGKGWTNKQSGEFRALLRYTNVKEQLTR